jgi:hypothetical protein
VKRFLKKYFHGQDPPPNQNLNIPLFHKLDILYQTLYRIGTHLPKRDKLGIWTSIETQCLEIITLVITAAFTAPPEKQEMLAKARIHTEIIKRLIRSAHELRIIQEKTYISLQSSLQEISKMIYGWIRYLQRTNSQ